MLHTSCSPELPSTAAVHQLCEVQSASSICCWVPWLAGVVPPVDPPPPPSPPPIGQLFRMLYETAPAPPSGALSATQECLWSVGHEFFPFKQFRGREGGVSAFGRNLILPLCTACAAY